MGWLAGLVDRWFACLVGWLVCGLLDGWESVGWWVGGWCWGGWVGWLGWLIVVLLA